MANPDNGDRRVALQFVLDSKILSTNSTVEQYITAADKVANFIASGEKPEQRRR